MNSTTDSSSSRRKFLKWSGLGSLVMIAGIQFRKLFFLKKRNTAADLSQTVTVKMLTEDGKLVEVAISDLGCAHRKRISDEELKGWIKAK